LIDFRLFEHALSNLILNAVQYAGDHLCIEIVVKIEGSQIILKISDNGNGISEENQKHLFEKFYRVPLTPAGGTGLGLSIVKGIVELHKGQIRYERNVPQGSSFIISLPLLEPPQVQKEVT
ncbi:MAG TPA: ATP-binding protein, partial [Pseudobdellovibrionaceae bacterium]|nr:ATP-binding protein [Pseudobdellovibrionaceae bacterium]